MNDVALNDQHTRFVDRDKRDRRLTRNLALRAAARMPRLDHYIRGRPFNIRESAVCDWLCSQDEIRQEIFNWTKRNGAIVFDVATGQWVGAYYRE